MDRWRLGIYGVRTARRSSRHYIRLFLRGRGKYGNVCAAEINALKEVAMAMGMSDREVESMLNLKGSSLDDAYKVLEIEPTATDEEVRAAYRRMAVKHHPDKVASLGEDIRKAANEKFQKINEAKERIYQSRGLK